MLFILRREITEHQLFFAPDGTIGDKLCRTSGCCDAIAIEVPVGDDTIGSGLCGQHGSELL